MFMQTHLKHRYKLDWLPVEIIEIEDIAHSLSLICRFIGHTDSFYSVAQHSILVAQELRREGYDAKTQFIGLMHDATEAYLGDIPTPIKALLPYYKTLEETFWASIAMKYHLPHELPPEVKVADGVLLATEARDLMGDPQGWGLKYEPSKHITKITSWDPRYVKQEFLLVFRDLQVEMKGYV